MACRARRSVPRSSCGDLVRCRLRSDGVSCSQRCARISGVSRKYAAAYLPYRARFFAPAQVSRCLLAACKTLASGELRYFSFRAVAGARKESSRQESTEKITAPTKHQNRLPVCVISLCRGTHAVITAAGVLVTYGEAARRVRGPRKAARRQQSSHQGQHSKHATDAK